MLSLIVKCAVNITEYLLTKIRIGTASWKLCTISVYIPCIHTHCLSNKPKVSKKNHPFIIWYIQIRSVCRYTRCIIFSIYIRERYMYIEVCRNKSEHQNDTRGYQNLVTVKYFFKYNSREYRIEFSNRWLNGTVSAITRNNMFQTSKLSLSLRINNISIFAIM